MIRYRGKSDPGTGELVHSVQALKCAEEAVRMVLVESGPVVSNKKSLVAIRLESAKLNLRPFSFGCKFPRISEKVLQHDP